MENLNSFITKFSCVNALCEIQNQCIAFEKVDHEFTLNFLKPIAVFLEICFTGFS